MAYTATDVKNLRERTGAGMMDCKKALEEAGGDMERAAELLRAKGIAKAEKRAGRSAAQGLIALRAAPDGTSSNRVPPAATARTAETSAGPRTCLSRKPEAPARTAASRASCSE